MTVDEEYNEQNESTEDVEEFVLTRKRFSKMVEEYVSSHPDSSYMDAVLEVCETRAIDPHDISTLICRTIKQKIEAEAIRNNLIKGGRKDQELPI